MVSMRGRLHHVILDCPDPAVLARFYSALLDQPITHAETTSWSSQSMTRRPGLRSSAPPTTALRLGPTRLVPQQIHLDVMVEDVDRATPHVLGLGATKLPGVGVFADPAGHPFCLIKRPSWAEPIPD